MIHASRCSGGDSGEEVGEVEVEEVIGQVGGRRGCRLRRKSMVRGKNRRILVYRSWHRWA